MLIEYTAYDREGRRVSGKVEAESEQVAEDMLWQAELIVSRVRKVRRMPGLHEILPSMFGVKERQVISLARQLATLLDSGLPLLLSLQALGHDKNHPMITGALQGIMQDLSEGRSFSDGLARYPKIFPRIFVRLSRIGEQTGEISDILVRGGLPRGSGHGERKTPGESNVSCPGAHDGGDIDLRPDQLLHTYADGSAD